MWRDQLPGSFLGLAWELVRNAGSQAPPISLNQNVHFNFIHIYIKIKKNFGRAAWHGGILIPWPGIETMPPALQVQSFYPWTAREVPEYAL